MDSFEKDALSRGFRTVAGIDEVGRGPLAGPVVAAAVVFTPALMGMGIKDSKKLTPKKRETLALDIYMTAPAVGVGVVWPEEVDAVNIHRATLKAMAIAAEALPAPPDHLLIDGIFTVDTLAIPQTPVKSGDSRSVAIAAASIIAKTTRDSIMVAYHSLYPCYNFLKNKGYGTREHLSALHSSGPSPIHRKSFNYTPVNPEPADPVTADPDGA